MMKHKQSNIRLAQGKGEDLKIFADERSLHIEERSLQTDERSLQTDERSLHTEERPEDVRMDHLSLVVWLYRCLPWVNISRLFGRLAELSQPRPLVLLAILGTLTTLRQSLVAKATL